MLRRPEAPPRRGTSAARHRWAATLGTVERGDAGVVAEDRALLDPGPPEEAADGVAPAVLRWRMGRGMVVLLAVISVLLGGWFWWQAADGAPRVQPLGDPPGVEPADGSGTGISGGRSRGPETAAAAAAGETQGAGHAGGQTSGPPLVVHVTGAVVRPGVLELPAGSRLHEAITAAGGSTPAADLDRLNLAAVLEDGQKIVVPERGSPDAAPATDPAGVGGASNSAGASGGAGSPAGKVNLNTAGIEELATLPRVGPVLAQRIVEWRKQHGRFNSVEELDAVDGVGPKLLEALLPLVRI